jgi:hypothetical protein
VLGLKTTQTGNKRDITAAADGGGGEVDLTSTAHGLTTGDEVTITETTDYNGTFTVTVIDANTFSITDTWVDSQTGKWQPVIDSEFFEPESLGADPVIVGTNYLLENSWRYATRYFNATKRKDLLLFADDAAITYDEHTDILDFTNNDE